MALDKALDYEKIKEAAEGYRADMVRFLRQMISRPSESCEEKEVVECIKAEMEKVGFDKVEIDGLGNVIGWIGDGDKILAIDSHVDTVGIGNIENWDHDPYEGYETDEIIYGRGGSDQEGGMASAVYAAKIMKDLDLIPRGYKIMIVGSVQEEDCDGMCWQYIYNKDKIVPEFVISTEPTDGGIYRGHRGRMEIRVDVKGISCHGSAPERGDNAIYKMADIIADVRSLNENGCGEEDEIKGLVKMLEPEYNPDHYEDARFLGRGTCTVSQIFYTSPSRCAVADSCSISIDRRMTAGETWAPAKSTRMTSRSPCTCTTDPPGPEKSMRQSAISPPGSTKRTRPMSRPWRMRTEPSTVTGASPPPPLRIKETARSSTSGRFPPTAFRSRADTESPALASDPEPKARPMRRTK